jgi:dTDP-4-dehydrorhamnose 3,5-epimerase
MNLNFEKIYTKEGLEIKGLLKIYPKIIEDERGFFFESWNKKNWESILNDCGQKNYNFVQDNHSKSSMGVLRGLHFQKNPMAQGKLVRCIRGEIFDVAVDLRRSSSTFCKWFGINLSSSNKCQFWIPKGFAHGFLTLSKEAEVMYKTTEYWDKECEKSIIWNDKDINIDWPLENIQTKLELSEKDLMGMKVNTMNDEDLF